jgi:hypothetical protein
VNSVSLAGRVASLLPNTTATAMDSPQFCTSSCADKCGVNHGDGQPEIRWLCCVSGCWSQGCICLT